MAWCDDSTAPAPIGPVLDDLDGLVSRAEANLDALEEITTGDPEIREALGHATSAQRHQLRAIKVLRRAIKDNDPRRLEGPGGYAYELEAQRRDIDQLARAMDAYVEVHHLTIEGSEP